MIAWVEKGIICFVAHIEYTDTYNGYVSVPQNHPWFEQNYDSLPDVSVHGGLTFSDYINNWDEWVVGFDTCHAADNYGENAEFSTGTQDGTYKDLDYVKRETEDLLEQAIHQLSDDQIKELEKDQDKKLSKFLLLVYAK